MPGGAPECHDSEVAVISPPPRLTRRPGGGMVAGVARGLADHLGIGVGLVRAAFVVLAFCSGAGLVAYAALWYFAPLDSALDEAAVTRARPHGRTLRGRTVRGSLLGALVLLAVTAAFLHHLVPAVTRPTIWPFAVVGLGVGIVWWQADTSQRARWFGTSPGARWAARGRVIVGVALVAAGSFALVGVRGGIAVTTRALVASLVLVLGIGLVTLPWWARMARDLTAERAARVREQERAEVAAHLHDSVLHTLTLIQRKVDDPREVARLARAQERELRAWLYRPQPEAAATFAAALARTLAEVEDAHGVTIEAVTVGDAALNDRLQAVLRAVREAAVNAAKHGAGSPISVYAEVEEGRAEVFVRDRGPGFDPAAVPEDRLGVRQSILGRMERHGGRATIRSESGEGTEVHLEMAVSPNGYAAEPSTGGKP